MWLHHDIMVCLSTGGVHVRAACHNKTSSWGGRWKVRWTTVYRDYLNVPWTSMWSSWSLTSLDIHIYISIILKLYYLVDSQRLVYQKLFRTRPQHSARSIYYNFGDKMSFILVLANIPVRCYERW